MVFILFEFDYHLLLPENKESGNIFVKKMSLKSPPYKKEPKSTFKNLLFPNYCRVEILLTAFFKVEP